MIGLAAVVALSLSASPACPLPPLRAGEPPLRAGETLGFDLDVMGIVKAGTLTATVERPMLQGNVVPLRARVKNTSVFAKVRKVSATAMSWVDGRTLRPERYRDEATEDGVRKTTDARLTGSGAGQDVQLSWQSGDKKGMDRFERKGEVLDLLSAIYYLRAADLRPGDTFCFDLLANRRFWRLSGSVAARKERVDSPAGSFDTLRLDAVAARADRPSAKRPIHIWISSDARHLPVAAVSEIDLGPVRAMLSRVTAPE